MADLPSKSDFNPSGFCPDAGWAWGHFGGLSVDEAYRLFCTNPINFQEVFMFMGGVAFLYYFSVIERYVLESRADVSNEYEVDAMSILAHCVKQHFDVPDTQIVASIRLRAIDLAAHVRKDISQYSTEASEQNRISASWSELHATLANTRNA